MEMPRIIAAQVRPVWVGEIDDRTEIRRIEQILVEEG